MLTPPEPKAFLPWEGLDWAGVWSLLVPVVGGLVWVRGPRTGMQREGWGVGAAVPLCAGPTVHWVGEQRMQEGYSAGGSEGVGRKDSGR